MEENILIYSRKVGLIVLPMMILLYNWRLLLESLFILGHFEAIKKLKYGTFVIWGACLGKIFKIAFYGRNKAIFGIFSRFKDVKYS